MGTMLRTDRYELTMLSDLVASGRSGNRAVFELFARRLPTGRRFGLLAGLGRLLDELEDLRFDPDELDWLIGQGVITPAVAEHLATWRFTGDVDAYPEGSLYWPHSPVMQVRGTLADAMVLETLALSILNHDTAVASAAARMVLAAGGRPIIEMGSRRVHEEAAVSAARAAYLAGFASTSNLLAGRRYGVPTVGTAAHAFTMAHRTEQEAFAVQVAEHGPGTTLLVDTYDTDQGIRNAVAAARAVGAAGPRAVRLDSGDLVTEARRARDLLDSLGAWSTWVTVTSDLDEHAMAELAHAPVDVYGAGTRVVTGSGHPTAGFVYKLVAVADDPGTDAPLRPVAKSAAGKASTGGRKTVHRHDDGTEHWTLDGSVPHGTLPVMVPAVRDGRVVHRPDLETVRAHAADQLASLPPAARLLTDGPAHQEAGPEPEPARQVA